MQAMMSVSRPESSSPTKGMDRPNLSPSRINKSPIKDKSRPSSGGTLSYRISGSSIIPIRVTSARGGRGDTLSSPNARTRSAVPAATALQEPLGEEGGLAPGQRRKSLADKRRSKGKLDEKSSNRIKGVKEENQLDEEFDSSFAEESSPELRGRLENRSINFVKEKNVTNAKLKESQSNKKERKSGMSQGHRGTTGKGKKDRSPRRSRSKEAAHRAKTSPGHPKKSKSKDRSPDRKKGAKSAKLGSERTSRMDSQLDKSPDRRSTSRGKGAASAGTGSRHGSSRASFLSASRRSAGTGSKADDNKPKKVIIKSPNLSQWGLTSHDISFKGLTQVPLFVFELENIGELDLSGNNLRTVPADIQRLVHLRALNLSQNSLKCSNPNDFTGLPREFQTLAHLEVLAISECNLRHAPPAIFLCSHLIRLDISRNKFSLLPTEAGNLTMLEYLNLSETSLKTLPPEIAYCEVLNEINLYGNKVENLPETMRELHHLKVLSINTRAFCRGVDQYMDRHLKNGQIQSEHIPTVLFEIPDLQRLDLESTRINNIPVGCASKLRELSLANNYFSAVPEGIKAIPTLVTFDLSCNFLPSLPNELSEYVKFIKVLKLAGNLLEKLPDDIAGLKLMEYLDVSQNRLKELPGALGLCKNLRTLRASRNFLQTLPSEICDLFNLRTLDLSRNRLTRLPVHLYKLRRIKTIHTFSHMEPAGLWLHCNPIADPPQEIWQTEDIGQLFSHLQNLEVQRTENLQRLKVTLLGEQGCGKSSLLDTLRTNRELGMEGEEDWEQEESLHYRLYLTSLEQSQRVRPLPRDWVLKEQHKPLSTNLVDIVNWKTENDVRFCMYDMGGSTIYTALHQHLIDPKALHLVIFDISRYTPDRYEEAIGHWLRLLQYFAPAAVVKVIGVRAANLFESAIEEVKSNVESNIAKQIENYNTTIEEEIQKVRDEVRSLEESLDYAAGEEVHNHTERKLELLQENLERMENLQEQTLRLQPDMAIVSCEAGLPGIPELRKSLEMLAIDANLFPHNRRYIPSSWQPVAAAIKRLPGYKLTMATVKEIAKKHHVMGDEVFNCLRHLCNEGTIFWWEGQSKLSDVIFHRPTVLINILASVFRNNFPTYLDYFQNKVFSSVGQLTELEFEEAKQKLSDYGELSRPMLQSLLFFLQPNWEQFLELSDLLEDMELAYVVPQSVLPTSTSYLDPFLVVPSFVRDIVSDLDWTAQIPVDVEEAEESFEFPLGLPPGAFERMSTSLHKEAESRIDWENMVFIDAASCQIFLERQFKHTDGEDKNGIAGNDLDDSHQETEVAGSPKENESTDSPVETESADSPKENETTDSPVETESADSPKEIEGGAVQEQDQSELPGEKIASEPNTEKHYGSAAAGDSCKQPTRVILKVRSSTRTEVDNRMKSVSSRWRQILQSVPGAVWRGDHSHIKQKGHV